MRGKFLQSILTGLLLFGLTAGIFLYTAGYRIGKDKNTNHVDITQTGMINVKSSPDGANVYLNGELKTATNGAISSLTPGTYSLRILKNGFVAWEKDIEVFSQLVTDITAILVSQSPRLEPLTNTGARQPTISPTLSKLAFFTKDGDTPGVWVIPLTGETLNLFRSSAYVVLEDAPGRIYSNGISIEWSPDEDELLVQGENEGFYLVTLQNDSVISAANPDLIRKNWTNETTKKRLDFIEKLDIPDGLREIAVAPDTVWAPDGKKFLYRVTAGNNIEYHVFNMEKPIPVGEKVENVAFSIDKNAKQPAVSWYADSFHLILVEADKEIATRGMVSLVRIDGTNKVEVFNNNLYSDQVFSAPGGDKLILLTSFKSEGQTDLYTVGIR